MPIRHGIGFVMTVWSNMFSLAVMRRVLFGVLRSPSRQARLPLTSYRGKPTSAASASAAASPDADVEPKPYSDIPGPKGLPIIGSLIDAVTNFKEGHKWINALHEEHGPILKLKAGILENIFISDADAVEQLLRQEGKYPQRLQIDIWLDYRQRHDIPLGLVMSDGTDWYRSRKVMDKRMLKIPTVNSYAQEFNDVVKEFIDRMYRVRRADNSIPDMDEELFGWSLESISRILYEKRLGCLADTRDSDAQAFINSSHDIFESTRRVMLLPPKVAKVLLKKSWKKHEAAWDTAFRVANKAIDKKLEDNEKSGEQREEFGFISGLLKEDTLTRKEIYSNVSELMGAAIDTTSNTTQMMMYELSRNPDVQKTLLDEVNRVVPRGEQPTPEHLRDMHYLKAVIKETLRMYPIVPIVFRILQNDAEILGYKIPKGTAIGVHLYVLGRHRQYYEEPNVFNPDRWLRESRKSRVHPFAWLPFGFGPRMCVGRRVAELEIQLLMSQLVRKFSIEPVTSETMEMKTDLILLPKSSVQIRLVDRN